MHHHDDDADDTKQSKNSTQKNIKTSNSAATKISHIIDDLFLPMLESTQLKPFTNFTTINVKDFSLIDHIALQDPHLVQSKRVFLSHLGTLYDEWQST